MPVGGGAFEPAVLCPVGQLFSSAALATKTTSAVRTSCAGAVQNTNTNANTAVPQSLEQKLCCTLCANTHSRLLLLLLLPAPPNSLQEYLYLHRQSDFKVLMLHWQF